MTALIPAAGRGERFGATENKVFLPLLKVPVLVRTIRLFQALTEVSRIVVVTAAEERGRVRYLIDEYGLDKVEQVVEGGPARQESVFRGLQAFQDDGWVAIHDAARPLTSPEAILACIEAAKESGAALCAVPVRDTVKWATHDRWVDRTLDRNQVWLAQTPQVFDGDLILRAHQSAAAERFVGTDDAMLVERLGQPVRLVEGSTDNIKITTLSDWRRAEQILSDRGEL